MDDLQVDVQTLRQEARKKDLELSRLSSALSAKGRKSAGKGHPPHDAELFHRGAKAGAVLSFPFLERDHFKILFSANDYASPLRWTSPGMQLRGKLASLFRQFPRSAEDVKEFDDERRTEDQATAMFTEIRARMQTTLREDPATQIYVSRLQATKYTSMLT